MKTMDYVFADYLFPDQLMEGDIIKLDHEFYEVSAIIESDDEYIIDVFNDFNEAEAFHFKHTDKLEWYVLVDE